MWQAMLRSIAERTGRALPRGHVPQGVGGIRGGPREPGSQGARGPTATCLSLGVAGAAGYAEAQRRTEEFEAFARTRRTEDYRRSENMPEENLASTRKSETLLRGD